MFAYPPAHNELLLWMTYFSYMTCANVWCILVCIYVMVVWYILTIRGREIPRKILTVPTSDGENNILSRIGGMSEELYVPRVAPRASPRGKPSGMPLGQHSGHTNLVTISCKGIFWNMVIVILRIYFYLIMRTKCHYLSFNIFSNNIYIFR